MKDKIFNIILIIIVLIITAAYVAGWIFIPYK